MPKSRAAASLARKRWDKTRSPAARREATAAATAARWPRCVRCGETETNGLHRGLEPQGCAAFQADGWHYFEPKCGDK